MINCASARHRGNAPVAVVEWFDVVTSEWRPVCAECEAIATRLGEAAANMLPDPLARSVAERVALRFRPLQ